MNRIKLKMSLCYHVALINLNHLGKKMKILNDIQADKAINKHTHYAVDCIEKIGIGVLDRTDL